MGKRVGVCKTGFWDQHEDKEPVGDGIKEKKGGGSSL